MQTEQQGEAEAKFWETPELLERLLSTLDLDSTFSLARVMNKEILKRSMTAKVWTTLVRQSFETMVIPDVPSDDDADSLAVAQKLASILKIMKTPKAFLLDALHVICERLPPSLASSRDDPDKLQVSCPSHSEPHSISGWGFILLEEMEAALRTTEQSIRSVLGVYIMCSFLRVLIMKTYLFQRFMKTYIAGQ